MPKTKIDIGIYLGNDYSAIARIENGEPVIQRTNVQKDTMPTFVSISRKARILVGDSAFRAFRRERQRALYKGTNINSFTGFIQAAGTDKKYYSSNIDKTFSPEELIAEIIKGLRSFTNDKVVKAAVITVPANFTLNQINSIIKASKLAGLKQVELISEPIATALAYGLDTKLKNGYCLTFDFGKNRFNTALLKIENDIKIIDTEQDLYIGGENLDYAIIEKIIIPHIKENFSISKFLADDIKAQNFKDTLKFWAEELSFKDKCDWLYIDPGDAGEDDNGEEIEIDLRVNQEMMKNTLEPIFQKAIDICKNILERNNLSNDKLDSLILVGKSTYSPILRKMLEEQIIKPDTSIDPVTAVAKGAALYASTIDISDKIIEQDIDKTKIQLAIVYEATTVEKEELVTVKILRDKTEGKVPDTLFVEIVRSDNAWTSGKTEIGEKGDVFEVMLVEGKLNSFNVLVYNEQGDLLPSEPSEFTIIQNPNIYRATLPYNIGIEVKSKSSGKIVFKTIKGLEKNQSLPATGVINGLKTEKEILPGSKNVALKIPLYQGEHGADDTRAIYNEHIFDVIITGEDLPTFLPAGSDVDITVKIDKSERITLSAYFPKIDYTHEIDVSRNIIQKEIDTNWLESEINKAIQTLNTIKQEGIYQDYEKLHKLDADLFDIKKRFEQGRDDYDRKKEVLDRLRRSLKILDEIQEELKGIFSNKKDLLLEIDKLKTKLLDLFDDNENFTKDVFVNLYDNLFDLVENIEKNNFSFKDAYLKLNRLKNKLKDVTA